ncbi:MAG: Ketosteroid isomerase-related protein [Solirubrobacterales bacterium]|nr:Ketosteroid isomerase-related protein [Solirubrobacterales bacterium]
MPEDVAANEALIERLYAAMNDGDGDAMAACYAPDATFEDPAFGHLEDGRGQAMWRMLCSRAGGDLEVTLVERRAEPGGTGTAHWLADYTFTETGRKVHNDVHASFIFRDGLIAAHRDRFDLRVWGGQALGPIPGLLGYTPLLGLMVRRRTAGSLAGFMAKD